jgi:hypothetical protein
VADSTLGSSASTAFAGNARSVVTAGGRVITVHGSHGEGLQLAWRDIGGVWQRATIGPIEDGRVLSGTETGDWTASIAVGTDRDGREHAWLMWAGATFTSTPRPAGIVRLSDLDAPWGPTVGEDVTLDDNSSAHAALAFDAVARRLALVWTRRSATDTYEVITGWVTDLESATPAIDGEVVLSSSASSNRNATVVVGPDGATYVVGPIESDGLGLYVHPGGADVTGWVAGTAVGAAAATGSSPSAVVLPDGDILAAIDTAAGATVHRFSATGSAFEIELADPGLRNPALAAGGDQVVMVGVRGDDGYVVSRSRDAFGGWADEERVEIGAEGGGNHSWPNPVRALDGRLRFIVQGPAIDPNRTTVYWFQRVL